MRVWSALLLMMGLGVFVDASVAGIDPREIPAELAGWRDWVRHDQDYRACPLMAGSSGDSADAFICAWPDSLEFAVAEAGASFSQNWTLYARAALPLPGDSKHWPQAVMVNGSAAPVVRLPGRETPVIWLAAGSYRVNGRFDWGERPASITVPGAVARIALRIDGRVVSSLQRDGERLWLGRAASVDTEADSFSLQVFRLLEDRQPQRLVTQLRLQISGKGRELVLPAVLPTGFAPVALDSALSARLEADGSLHIQARPGHHEITLTTRALAPLDEIPAPSHAAPWPDEEVWSYQSMPERRVSSALGPPQVDPNLAEVPPGWRELPAFAMAAGAVLKIDQQGRGLSDQDQNHLRLSRELWLDFSGQGFSSHDRIQGRLVRDWRLDMAAPFALTRASENGSGLLVTAGATPGQSGVELRARDLELDASSRISRRVAELPLTGWQQRFDAVATILHLPPGYELVAAFGADRAPAAWLDRWDLLDVFFAALLGFLAVLAFGRLAALATIGYLLLAWHLPDAPRFSLLLALALGQLAAAVRQSPGLARWSGRLAQLTLLWVVIVTLPFAAGQIRQALYPQLEPAGYAMAYGRLAEGLASRSDNFATGAAAEKKAAANDEVVFDEAMPMAEEAPPPAPPATSLPASMAADGGKLAAAESPRSNRPKRRYTSDSVVQAGAGEPAWQWRDYSIEVAGPVLPSQSIRLLLSPPWLTRLARLAIVLLLAFSLWRMGQGRFNLRLPKALASAALLALLGSGQLLAAATPAKDFVAELGERLRELPECSPQCGRIARADLRFSVSRFEAALELHAAERLALPLPGNEKLLPIARISLDGSAVGGLRRAADGSAWIVVPRGVHRVQIEWTPAAVDAISLRFPDAPGYTGASGSGWAVAGIDAGRLESGSVQFTRMAQVEPGTEGGVAGDFPPYVIVSRALQFDREWTITTSVQRIAPAAAAFNIRVPVLAGEHLLSDAMNVIDGQVSVPFAEGVQWLQWQSRLDPAEALVLTAPDQAERSEVWQVDASPGWHVVAEGVPAVHTEVSMYLFYPLPGEPLRLSLTRPAALPGNTLAIDRVAQFSRIGKRSSEHQLQFELRATQGGQHPIDLPAGAQVTEVRVNQLLLNLRPEQDRLSLPVRPGSNQVSVAWRDEVGAGPVIRSPALALNAPSSNLALQLSLPADRWVLAVTGPRVGPAVLYWGELLVMALLALALARTGATPLGGRDWLLLGIGFSTVSWWALVCFIAWLFALGWRARIDPSAWRWRFNLVQIGLVLLTLVALAALFGAIRTGLLGSPDLHVVGNQSTAQSLNWFHDQTDSRLPIGTAISLPIWVYRALMLAWSFWMASALIRWLRWALVCFTRHATWLPWRRRLASPETPASASTAGLDKDAL